MQLKCPVTVYSTTTSAGTWSFKIDGSPVAAWSKMRCTTETKVYLFDKLLVRSENHDGKWDDATGAYHAALQIDTGCLRLEGRILAFINGEDVSVPFSTEGTLDRNSEMAKYTLTDVGLGEWAEGLCNATKIFMRNEGRRHLDGRAVEDHQCEGKVTSWDLIVHDESLTLEFAYKQQQRMVLT